MSSIVLIGLLLSAGVVSTGGEGAAAPPPAATSTGPTETEATALVKAAAHQYDQGLLDEAVRTLERARALSPRPSILFNIAQVQRARRDCPAALAAYKSFAAQTPPTDPNHQRALRWQAEMEKCIEAAAVATSAADSTPPAAQPKVAAAQVVPAPAVPVSLVTRPAVHQDVGLAASAAPPAPIARRRHTAAQIAGWSLLGAGALAEVAALLLEWKAMSIESDLNNGGLTKGEYSSLQQDGHRAAQGALWTAVGGGVLAVGGGAFLLINRPSAAATSPTALVGWMGTF